MTFTIPSPNSQVSRSVDLKHWFVQQALPFWDRRGWDAVHGGVHERMLWNGDPDLITKKRFRVQARQMHVYSYAAAAGWYPEGTRFALNVLDWVRDKAWSPDGKPGYVHLLHPDGSVADCLRDTYDHMFILMGLAWLARASGDAQVRTLLDEALAYVDEHLTSADGAFLEGVPATLPRRQNPHMHAFEAMLVLHQTIGHPEALARAERIRAFLEDRFLRPAPILHEFFGDDWQPVAGKMGKVVEPGHQAEWAWLLRWHERVTKRSPGPLASQLLDSALDTADPMSGFLVDEADCCGNVQRGTRRLWPQTELAEAWMSEAGIGREGAFGTALQVLATLEDTYLGKPMAAGWIDQFSADGEIMVDTVPASTLYHILGLVIEFERVLGPIGQQARRSQLSREQELVMSGSV